MKYEMVILIVIIACGYINSYSMLKVPAEYYTVVPVVIIVTDR